MIHIRDSLLLASTKLRNRRLRLSVTVLVSGLLFIGLAYASFILNGATSSIEKFSEEGFGKRYLISVTPAGFPDDYAVLSSPEVLNAARSADKTLIASKKAEAKRLGLEYNESTETLSVNEQQKNYDGSITAQYLPHTKALIMNARLAAASAYFTKLDSLASQYDAIARFDMKQIIGPSNAKEYDSPSFTLIKEGKEATGGSFNTYQSSGIDSILNGLNAANDTLLENFLLPGQSLKIGEDGTIPVIAPYSAAQEALGLKQLPQTATSEEKLSRLQEVRDKIGTTLFQACIRNQTSANRQQEAEQLQQNIELGKSQKDYVQPELVYAKSQEPCQDVVVTRDVRSRETKAFTAKQDEFNRIFGAQTPSQRMVRFRIVGVVADPPGFGSFNIKTIIAGLLSSNIGSGWFIPQSAQTALPEYADSFAAIGKTNSYDSFVVLEFSNVDAAKRFVKDTTCDTSSYMGGGGPTTLSDICSSANTPFFVSPFGSNSVALSDIKSGFNTIFRNIGLVLTFISVVIMMGTVGKIIADSRRETAVFRAIGAKRSDIAQIYLTYTFLIGIAVSIFVLSIGWLLANFTQQKVVDDLTIEALLAYGSSDLTRRFVVVGVNTVQILTLVGFIICASLLSAVGPLVANLKRNPIKDMRDER